MGASVNNVCRHRSHLLAAAAIMHDIGKVLEPAGIQLDESARRLEQQVCPSDRRTGAATHRHVLFTAHVLNRARSNFGGLRLGELFRIAVNHHRPTAGAFDEHLMQKADWLASGHDRRDHEHVEDISAVTALQSVTSTLFEHHAPEARFIRTCELSVNRTAFEPVLAPTRDQYAAACRMIADKILASLQRDFRDEADCVDRLLALAQRLLCNIPSSRTRGEIPDVSLFDHSRVVAAFATCLGMIHQDGPDDARRISGKYRMVGVGIGGIQAFILRDIPLPDRPYTQKGRAKRLRARSFYVSLLGMLAARKLLAAIHLPNTNILIEAGSNATLLIPDLPECIEAIRTAITNMRHWCAKTLGGALRLDVTIGPPLTDDTFAGGAISSALAALGLALEQSRHQPASHHLWTSDGWAPSEWVFPEPSLPIDKDRFLKSLTDLGSRLPRAKFMTVDGQDSDGLLREPLDILGCRVQFHADRPTSSTSMFALQIDEDDPSTPLFLTGSHVPLATTEDAALCSNDDDQENELIVAGDPLTFGVLAGRSSGPNGETFGHTMLGAIKADMDQLGLTMRQGLGKRVSAGRLATLSRNLDLFFKGRIPNLLEEQFPYIYTVFAGGDDLFFVGPWYDVVRFAGALHDSMQQYVSHNPGLHLSAGVAFTKPTTPIRVLAEAADAAIGRSKDSGRNRITVGQLTLTWSEFTSCMDLHGLLLRVFGPGGEAADRRGFVYRLMSYANMALRVSAASGTMIATSDLKWRAQLSYDLKRNLRLEASSMGTDVHQLHSRLIAVRDTDAASLRLGAMLTLYCLRGTST